MCALTTTQWSHFRVLRVHLRDVGNSLTEHVHWNLVAVLVLPVGGLVTSSLDLRSAVSCDKTYSLLLVINAIVFAFYT